MELTNSILVAMMLVMVLSIGIANILGAPAAVAAKRSTISLHWMGVSWPLLLILAHLGLFWHTLALVEVESGVSAASSLCSAGRFFCFWPPASCWVTRKD